LSSMKKVLLKGAFPVWRNMLFFASLRTRKFFRKTTIFWLEIEKMSSV
jgi:hypothetical protein